MKEPILSREEVEALAHRICMKYAHSDNEYLRQYTFGMLTLEQFAQAYEAALLEKLCGEPAAYINEVEFNCLKNNARAVVSPKGMKDDDETIPLYVINRTKS